MEAYLDSAQLERPLQAGDILTLYRPDKTLDVYDKDHEMVMFRRKNNSLTSEGIDLYAEIKEQEDFENYCARTAQEAGFKIQAKANDNLVWSFELVSPDT
jgi:hypothetical protein